MVYINQINYLQKIESKISKNLRIPISSILEIVEIYNMSVNNVWKMSVEDSNRSDNYLWKYDNFISTKSLKYYSSRNAPKLT